MISMKNFSQVSGPRHSTKTALVKIQMTCFLRRQRLHLVASLLDLNAAFDTIDHDILIDDYKTIQVFKGRL